MSNPLDSFINTEMVLGKNIKPGDILYLTNKNWHTNIICAEVKKVYITAYSGGFVDVVLNFHEDLLPLKINGDILYKVKKSSK